MITEPRIKSQAARRSAEAMLGRSLLLSGLGYYKLSLKRRKLLTYVIGGSLALHLAALLAFGGWIIMRPRVDDVTVFRTPPPVRRYEPRELEHKVKVQKQQRSSSRPAMLPRLVAMRPSSLTLPEIKVDPKVIHTTFQPRFTPVSGRGLGAGLGTGYGTHGFGSGVANMNFFGIQARGEKVALLLDVSLSMVEDVRGGMRGFEQVKRRINEVIDAMPDAALFNVIAFADAASAMNAKLEMVIANSDNKRLAKEFIRPFNSGPGHWGLEQGNIQPNPRAGLRAGGGTTRLDLALNAAYMMGADVILVFCDGLPMVQRVHTREEREAHRERVEQWRERNTGLMDDWDRRYAATESRTERVWVPPQPAQPARPPSTGPPKEGQAPDRGSPAVPAREGYWTTRTVREGGTPRPRPPALPDPGYWTLADFVTHLNALHEDLYVPRGQRPPQIHAIGYIIDNQGHEFLSRLARAFKGQYRRISQLR